VQLCKELRSGQEEKECGLGSYWSLFHPTYGVRHCNHHWKRATVERGGYYDSQNRGYSCFLYWYSFFSVLTVIVVLPHIQLV